ncbi:unnamed protein product, partial [Closterium sp. NIES-54]
GEAGAGRGTAGAFRAYRGISDAATATQGGGVTAESVHERQHSHHRGAIARAHVT